MHGLRHVTAVPIKQRLVDPALGKGTEAQPALLSFLLLRRKCTLCLDRPPAALAQPSQFLVPVAGLLVSERRLRANRHLLSLAFQVALEAPGLRPRRHDLQHQVAVIRQVQALVLCLNFVNRRGLHDLFDVSYAGHLEKLPRPPWRL